MVCPHCGSETAVVQGRCTTCGAALTPSGQVATGVLTPAPNLSDTDAATRLSGDEPPRRMGSQAPSARDGGRAIGPLAAGQNFGPRYHIIKLRGSGGMGAVYQAWDEELGVAVALKVIRPEITADPEAARDLERRFKRELLLARQVTHKNVVRIHDLGEIDGIKYLTMPYVHGSDLGGKSVV